MDALYECSPVVIYNELASVLCIVLAFSALLICTEMVSPKHVAKLHNRASRVNLKQIASDLCQDNGTSSISQILGPTSTFCEEFTSASPEEKHDCLFHLASLHQINIDSLRNMLQKTKEFTPKDEALRIAQNVRPILRPRYAALFRGIAHTSGGVKFLVHFREDVLLLLNTLRNSSDCDERVQELRLLDATLKDLLSVCFSLNLLSVERVTWQSPCALLQQIAELEAVHPIRDWNDLRARVGSYRRCFVFLHPALHGEPVVVLHVALMGFIAESIQFQNIISHTTSHNQNDPEIPEDISAAVFYSVTATQRGLQGIELGTFLIKQVLELLRKEFQHLSQFSSLSPIPGFRDWLIKRLKMERGALGEAAPPPLLSTAEMATLSRLLFPSQAAQTTESDVVDAFITLIDECQWPKQSTLEKGLKPILMRLCAHYLAREKHRGYALNPVANFHLRNGASLWRINWLADTNPRGLRQSCGLMVNYRYFLDSTSTQSQSYLGGEHEISMGPLVQKLLASDPEPHEDGTEVFKDEFQAKY